MSQPALDERLDAAALHGMLAARVVLLAAAGHEAHEAVQQQIARRRLEAEQMARLAVARQEHDVRHSAQMHENAVLAGLVEQQPIHEGREWKTLPPGRD